MLYYWLVDFELDPAHYLSTPHYSSSTMLKFFDINLKLISDIEKFQFIVCTICGRISIICKGYTEANNKFLKTYNVNKRTSYIIYLGTNNLHGNSMMQLLPTEMLDWANPKDFNLDNNSNDSLIDRFLEVDLDHTDESYDLHNHYPSG